MHSFMPDTLPSNLSKKRGRPKEITEAKELTLAPYVSKYLDTYTSYSVKGLTPPTATISPIFDDALAAYVADYGYALLGDTDGSRLHDGDTDGGRRKKCRTAIKNYISNQWNARNTSDPHGLLKTKEVDAMYDKPKKKLSKQLYLGEHYREMIQDDLAAAYASNSLLPVSEKRGANLKSYNDLCTEAWDQLDPDERKRVEDERRVFYENQKAEMDARRAAHMAYKPTPEQVAEYVLC
jgi:hypothetical protein